MTTGKPLTDLEFAKLRKAVTQANKIDFDKLRLIGTVETLQDQLRELRQKSAELATQGLQYLHAHDALHRQVNEARCIFTAMAIDNGGCFVVDMARPRTPPKDQRITVHRDKQGNVIKFEFEPLPHVKAEPALVMEPR